MSSFQKVRLGKEEAIASENEKGRKKGELTREEYESERKQSRRFFLSWCMFTEDSRIPGHVLDYWSRKPGVIAAVESLVLKLLMAICEPVYIEIFTSSLAFMNSYFINLFNIYLTYSFPLLNNMSSVYQNMLHHKTLFWTKVTFLIKLSNAMFHITVGDNYCWYFAIPRFRTFSC